MSLDLLEPISESSLNSLVIAPDQVIGKIIKLPLGVDIENLVDDLRLLSWEANEILLYYAQILKDPSNKNNIIENNGFKLIKMSDIELGDSCYNPDGDHLSGKGSELVSNYLKEKFINKQ